MPFAVSEHSTLEHSSRDAAPIGASPTPAQLRAILADAGLTQSHAAELCRSSLRGFTQWCQGSRTMPAASAELLCLAIIAAGRLPPGEWCAPWISADLQRLARRGWHRGSTVGKQGAAVETHGGTPP